MSWKKTVLISMAIGTIAFYAGRCSQEIEMKKAINNEVKYEKTQSIEDKLQDKTSNRFITDAYFKANPNLKYAVYSTLDKIEYEKQPKWTRLQIGNLRWKIV